MQYSPIARNFYRLRRLLMSALGLPRAVIRPAATFAELVPPEDRQRVWLVLEREGLSVPYLTLPPERCSALLLFVLIWAGAIALLYMSFLAFFIALADGGYLAYRWTRRWATAVNPQSMTLGEAAICMTTNADCRRADYRWSERDIFVKVRFALWEATGAPYEEIDRDARFLDIAD